MSQNLYKVEYSLTLNSPFSGSEITFVQYGIRFTSGTDNFTYYFDGVTTNESNTLTRDAVVNLSFNPDTINFDALTFGTPPIPCDIPSHTYLPYNSTTDISFLPLVDFNCTGPSGNGIPLIMARIDGLEAVNTTQGNNQLFNCEPRTISTINSSSFSMSYKVEYQIGSNTTTWTTLLPYARRSPDFEIEASDFTGLSSNNPNLRLRVSYDESGTTSSRSILALIFAQCSPEIVSISTTDTSCSYSEDGGFTVTFDRPLDTDNNEMLTSLSLTDATNDVFDDADDVELFQAIASTTYSGTQFTWPMSIPAGRYRLIYQSDGANSMEQYDPIIITSPPPLEYEVVIESDISCFNEANGSVRININPNNNGSIGSGSYYYTIGSDTTQNSFTGTTTIVNNLDITTIIKVFDGNDCTERMN